MDYTIESSKIKLTVCDNGGSMKSIVYLPTGEERQWQGNEFWKSQDVVIFPIIGHAGGFTVNGEPCELKSHGIIRYSTLQKEEQTKNKVTLSFTSNDETKKNYPYDFIFKISYEVIEDCISVSYFVKSLGGKMPFYVGGHPGMYAPDGEAIIEFENEEHPVCYPLDSDKAVAMPKLKRFVANKQFFAECKTLQLGNLSGGAIYARTADGFTYEYKSNCPLFAFWSNEQGGDYICVEPWWGINDFKNSPSELTLKPFMNFDDGKGSKFGYSLKIYRDL
jgi:galactose mutarotase-like enzyme